MRKPKVWFIENPLVDILLGNVAHLKLILKRFQQAIVANLRLTAMYGLRRTIGRNGHSALYTYGINLCFT